MVLKAEILWTKLCVFCESNAASSEIVKSDIKKRMGPDALQKMFQHSIRGKHGRKFFRDNLQDCDTTDVQAEVLVLDPIEPDLFLECAYLEGAVGDLEKIAKSHSIQFIPRSFYFGKRSLLW